MRDNSSSHALRDLLLRDNLFEIITSSRTFYIQVKSFAFVHRRLKLVAGVMRSQWSESFGCNNNFVFKFQVRLCWCFDTFSLNALLLMCGPRSALRARPGCFGAKDAAIRYHDNNNILFLPLWESSWQRCRGQIRWEVLGEKERWLQARVL